MIPRKPYETYVVVPASEHWGAKRGRPVLLVVIALQLLYQAYEFHRFSVHYEGLTKLNQYVLEHCSDFRDQPQCQQPDGCPLGSAR